jgi:hypothetical protein
MANPLKRWTPSLSSLLGQVEVNVVVATRSFDMVVVAKTSVLILVIVVTFPLLSR